MFYQIDTSRLLVLLLLLGAGMFIATRLVRPPQADHTAARQRRNIALSGMGAMTLLGLSSGVGGGLIQDSYGETTLVAVLHTIYAVCWAPAFTAAQLQRTIVPATPSSRFTADLLGLLGYLLVPVLWFVVFFCVGHLLARRHRPG
jgi:putative copper export protein